MLGSFYDKAWDLDHSAHESSHSFIASHPTDKLQDVGHSAEHLSVRKKMHLPNGDHTSQFSGISELHPEKNVQNHGVLKPERETIMANGPTDGKTQSSRPNEISVPIPQDREINEVLDTVLVAWVVLIHRYERDAFCQFTWGIIDTPRNEMQCISAVDLDISSQKTIVGLRSKVESVRTASIAAHSNSAILLNDGTNAEVCVVQ